MLAPGTFAGRFSTLTMYAENTQNVKKANFVPQLKTRLFKSGKPTLVASCYIFHVIALYQAMFIRPWQANEEFFTEAIENNIIFF